MEWTDLTTTVQLGNTSYQENTGYQTRCLLASGKCEYRCSDGYYGNPTTADSGCAKCPNSRVAFMGDKCTGVTLGEDSVAGENSTIEGCYVQSGSSRCDDSGNFTYNDDCFYSK